MVRGTGLQGPSATVLETRPAQFAFRRGNTAMTIGETAEENNRNSYLALDRLYHARNGAKRQGLVADKKKYEIGLLVQWRGCYPTR